MIRVTQASAEMMIRRAYSADVSAMFKVRTSVTDNHMSLELLAAVGITPASVCAMLAGSCRAWVTEDDPGQIAAFSMADAAEGSVFALFVRPECQQRGLGRALLTEAEGWLSAQGCQSAWLVTSGSAVHFYEHMGWANAGVQGDGQTRFTKTLTSAEQNGSNPVASSLANQCEHLSHERTETR